MLAYGYEKRWCDRFENKSPWEQERICGTSDRWFASTEVKKDHSTFLTLGRTMVDAFLRDGLYIHAYSDKQKMNLWDKPGAWPFVIATREKEQPEYGDAIKMVSAGYGVKCKFYMMADHYVTEWYLYK